MNKASRRRTGVAKTAVKKPTVKLPHIPRPEDILAGDIRVDSQIVLEREIAALTIQLWWRKLQAKKCVCLAIQHALAERSVFRDCYSLYIVLVSVRLWPPLAFPFPASFLALSRSSHIVVLASYPMPALAFTLNFRRACTCQVCSHASTHPHPLWRRA